MQGRILKFAFLCFAFFFSVGAHGQTSARELYNLAVTQTDQQKFQEAVINYNKAIALNPLFHEAWFSLGYTLQCMKQTAQAIEKYSQAIKIQPKDMYYLQRADAYSEIQKDGFALWDCNEAIKLNPDYTEAYYKRAMVYRSLHKEAEAVADYTYVLEKGYADDKLYFEIAWMYENLNQPDSAQKYYEISISKIPAEKYTYTRLAEVQQKMKNINKALDTYNQLVSVFPDYGYGYYLRAELYLMELNQRDRACADYKKALELGYSQALNAVENLCR